MGFRIMVHKETGNLGDQIQSVALSRLIGPSAAFLRDQAHLSYRTGDFGVAAGFMLGPTTEDSTRLLFSGIYWLSSKDNVEWLKRSPFPVGARDPATHHGLLSNGVKSELIGCVTLTFPRYDGPRNGEVSVDCDGPGERLTHTIPKNMSVTQEWEMCLERLEKYKTASLVHTSRIHVAMPCLALGTPVRYVGPMNDGRTSIMKELGLRPGEPCSLDVEPWKEKYIAFLERHLGIRVQSNAPVLPTLREGA